MQPRYLYWIDNFPVECLSFDREESLQMKKRLGKSVYPSLSVLGLIL